MSNYPSSTQPESNSYGQEDFEKVDPGDFDQQPAESERHGQVSTSTAYTGEEAEEDRYGTSDATPNLLNFGDDVVVEEPQSTTPSAPEVGDLPGLGGLGQFSEPDREAEAAPLNPFSDPISTTTTSAMNEYYGYGDEERDLLQPVSDPITNLLTESTESKDWEGKADLPISGGTWMKNVDPRESGEVNPAFVDDDDQLPIIEEWDSPVATPSSAPIEAFASDVGDQPSCSVCPSVLLELVYWRDVKKTGVVFGSMMFMLLSLAFFSVLSVAAYLALAALTITLSFRVYKNVLQAVQKTGDQHPFKHYLDMNIALPQDKVQQAVQNITRHVNNTSRELRRLFLIEDLVDSIKFGLFLWVLTYIGAWFNGMTIIILGVVAIFTLPKFYETYKTQIDNNLDLVRTNINKVVSQVKSKVPFPKKKEIKKE